MKVIARQESWMSASFPGPSVPLAVAISSSNWYLVFSHPIPSIKEFVSNCINLMSMVRRSQPILVSSIHTSRGGIILQSSPRYTSQ